MTEAVVETAVAGVSAAVDVLLSAPLEGLPAPALMKLVCDLEVQRRRLAGVDQRLIAALGSSGAVLDSGSTSLPDLVAGLTRCSRGEARARVGRSVDLGPRRAVSGEPLEPIHPLTAAAVAAGAVSEAQCQVIVSALAKIGPDAEPSAFEVAEQFLINAARHEPPAALARSARWVLTQLDPSGLEPSERTTARSRHFSLADAPDVDGGVVVRGRLTPETAAALRAVLGALSAPRPADGSGERDQRSVGQRQHDALLEIALRILRSGDLPDSGGVPASIIIQLRAQQAQTTHAPGDTTPGDTTPGDTGADDTAADDTAADDTAADDTAADDTAADDTGADDTGDHTAADDTGADDTGDHTAADDTGDDDVAGGHDIPDTYAEDVDVDVDVDSFGVDSFGVDSFGVDSFAIDANVLAAAGVLEGSMPIKTGSVRASLSGVAHLGTDGPVSLNRLQPLLDSCDITTVVLTASGGILDYGRERRTPPPAMRRALAGRDGGCCFPGCDRPPAWTEAHHILAWIDRGPTSLNNLCLLCAYHHRMFDQAGWRVIMRDGLPWWIPPAWLDPRRTPIRNTTRHLPAIDFGTIDTVLRT